MKYVFLASILSMIITACIDKDVYQGGEDTKIDQVYMEYLYPYGNEAQNIVAEITLEMVDEVDAATVNAVIPFLKYNKSWLFMLTQDDCEHSAYSTTWAAINGKPLSSTYYYSAEQLAAGDLPPDVFSLNKTLGSTDGTGQEVRFAFTTTLNPEMSWMNAETVINKGFGGNYSRFYKKSGLTWSNISEMLAYGTGIAFHDVNTQAVNIEDSIVKHYDLAQQIILNKLSGRGSKTLAEPNGNKTYVRAAIEYPPIKIMTAQNPGDAPVRLERLYPFQVNSDLNKSLLQRAFYDSPYDIVARIESQLRIATQERQAIHVGMHSTGTVMANFLLWLNNTYGKNGDDSVWFPSLEEYYEYNYYRINSATTMEVNGNKVTIRIHLPSEQFFYYPSITLNLSGVEMSQVNSINTNDAITGLSYADYEEGLMINIDCRKYLVEHAKHFVEKYESFPAASNKSDALYFVNKLKESSVKSELLQRIR